MEEQVRRIKVPVEIVRLVPTNIVVDDDGSEAGFWPQEIAQPRVFMCLPQSGPYRALMDAAEGEAPPLDGLGGSELVRWLGSNMTSWLAGGLQQQGEDFHGMPEDDKRAYLALAAEVLFGVNFCGVTLVDSYIEATTDE